MICINTDAQAIEAANEYHVAQQRVKILKEALEAYVEVRGPIPVGDQVLGSYESTRRTFDVKKTIDVFRDFDVPDKEQMPCLSIKATEVDKLCKKRKDGNNIKGALDVRKAIVTNQTFRFGFKKKEKKE